MLFPRRLQLARRVPRDTRLLTTLGIRREDPARIWERRVPLTPQAVATLLEESKGVASGSKDELRVQVESCKRRCFADSAYVQAGATIVPSLEPAVDLVLGIKEPPVSSVSSLLDQSDKKRTWMVFSHTHKGQSYNVPLLSAFMERSKHQDLIDYELLTAPVGGKGELKRVAAFGWFAGAVGAGEALSLTGLALLKRGIASPLLHLPRPYTFSSLHEYKAALRQTGQILKDDVAAGKIDLSDQPVVIGLTGAGNVSTGAKAMLDELGVEWVQPEDLPGLRGGDKIYACAVPPSAYFTRTDGAPYQRADYYANPTQYRSDFAQKVARHITCLINGAGWQTGFPRIMSSADLGGLIESQGRKQRLVAVQDVTCDLKGGLEFVDRHTTIDSPYAEGPGGILISTIDILPSELPKDASEHFSSKILPYVRHLTRGGVSPETDPQVRETLHRATIVRDGELTEKHAWLAPAVQAWRGSSTSSTGQAVPSDSELRRAADARPTKKKVLLLGSGLVAGPAVEVFAARKDVHLAIASNNLAEANGLIRNHENVEAFNLDISDADKLEQAVSNADVVVSLLPAPMHTAVAKHCIQHARHLITASYISPEMKALDQAAREKDVLLLGECGLDPGIDSMAAMRILDRVKRDGRRVSSFVSWCGGLPEPSASNVPLGYKFSWSPKAVLTAALNEARFKINGHIRTIPGERLLAEHFPKVDLWKGLALEGLANRDSIPYAEKYQGFSRVLESFRRLGLLSSAPFAAVPSSWADFLRLSIGQATGEDVARVDHLRSVIAAFLGDQAGETVEVLQWLSVLDSHDVAGLPKPLSKVPIDNLAALLALKLAYQPHERDSALLHHSFSLAPLHPTPGDLLASNSNDADRNDTVTASLTCYGTAEASAMSTTVGKTLAYAALRVADGHVRGRGVKGPYEREVWEGVLDELESAGVRVEEKWNVRGK